MQAELGEIYFGTRQAYFISRTYCISYDKDKQISRYVTFIWGCYVNYYLGMRTFLKTKQRRKRLGTSWSDTKIRLKIP